MSKNDLKAIDQAAHTAHEWVDELTERIEWRRQKDVLRLLRAVLVGLRDHIGHNEAAHLAAQLPLLIRGMYYEGWSPARTPLKDRRPEAFVSAIEARIGEVSDYRGPRDIVETFRMIADKVTEGEMEDVRRGLSGGLRRLLAA